MGGSNVEKRNFSPPKGRNRDQNEQQTNKNQTIEVDKTSRTAITVARKHKMTPSPQNATKKPPMDADSSNYDTEEESEYAKTFKEVKNKTMKNSKKAIKE